MNKLYEIARLVMTSTLSDRDISASLRVAKNTVRRYRGLATETGQTWEQLSALPPTEMEQLFSKRVRGLTKKRMPDFAQIHHELQTKGVTLLLLWEEYRAACPDDALGYSQFTHHCREFERKVKVSMRQVHRPGERVFVDFSGKRPSYVDPKTGERKSVELFAGALGYSHLIYALAVPTQGLADWIRANVAMLTYFGGVPQAIVPDNLRSAVTRSGREPVINRIYADLAQHYGTAILPARVYRPQDKGKVEVAVQIAQRWILARLRHHTFFSLAELNNAIRELLEELNNRPFKRLPGCRRTRFELAEKAALKPLPAHHYEYADWYAPQRVGPDYHVQVCGHWYSVPFQLVGQTIEARAGITTVELFREHQRVSCHVRSSEIGGHTTLREHMPQAHRAQADRTPERYQQWAEQIGPNLLAVVGQQFKRELPMLGLQACDALQRLARQHGPERLEAAAKRAVEIKSLTVKSIKSLLATGLRNEREEVSTQGSLPLHHNLRGPDYFSTEEGSSC